MCAHTDTYNLFTVYILYLPDGSCRWRLHSERPWKVTLEKQQLLQLQIWNRQAGEPTEPWLYSQKGQILTLAQLVSMCSQLTSWENENDMSVTIW